MFDFLTLVGAIITAQAIIWVASAISKTWILPFIVWLKEKKDGTKQ
jgi:hypothetical protein